MPSQPSNCPRCGSEQPFPRREKHCVGYVKEVYIQCTMCRWTQTIEHVTGRLNRLRKKKSKLIRLATSETQRYGRVTASTERQQNETDRRMAHEQTTINALVRRKKHAVPADV